ncbi:hypothetical protein [Pseudonocardia sp. TRM90224]|nr:hypothetical protein [Pseudonocardia sp. TRM90224]
MNRTRLLGPASPRETRVQCRYGIVCAGDALASSSMSEAEL